MHNIITQLVKEGITVTLLVNEKSVEVDYELDGFYKSGSVVLQTQPEGSEYPFLAVARYDEQTPIYDIHDVVELNLYWHNVSKDRFDGWHEYDPDWVGLIKKYQKGEL